jgi:hypothetical protein
VTKVNDILQNYLTFTKDSAFMTIVSANMYVEFINDAKTLTSAKSRNPSGSHTLVAVRVAGRENLMALSFVIHRTSRDKTKSDTAFSAMLRIGNGNNFCHKRPCKTGAYGHYLLSIYN